MITRHVRGEQRRALNTIWNAAGRYQFDPPFMAFFPDGSADFYFNLIIGFVEKWFDPERMETLFERVGRSARADEFDDLLWLGLENCVYEKEIGERPILAQLRRERAEKFFSLGSTLSRQQMMLQSMLTQTMQEVRWAEVSGRRMPPLSGRERRMAGALRFPGSLDTEGVLLACQQFLSVYFRWREPGEKGEEAGGQAENVPGILRHLLRRETRQTDSLVIRAGTGQCGDGSSGALAHRTGILHRSARTEQDLAYVEACFGPCAVSEHDLGVLESELCVGDDKDCRIWIVNTRQAGSAARALSPSRRPDREAGGSRENGPDSPDFAKEGGLEAEDGADQDLSPQDRRDVRRVRADMERQKGKNRVFYDAHRQEIVSTIRRLSAGMNTVLESYAWPLPEEGRAGQLEPEKAYRLPVLQDPDVFLHPGNEKEPDLSVELLLDASASRQRNAEVIAAQGRILAESLVRCHIPVRVLAFCSLRGVTVLRILKEWKESSCARILDYYAGGWNRDGLAIRTADALRIREDHHARRLLLVLTDASPNDSAKLPPVPGGVLRREYEGAPAVEAAASAVRAAREDGIHTAAVFAGSTAHLGSLSRIYGKEYVCIRKLDQLAAAVLELLRMTLQENENRS